MRARLDVAFGAQRAAGVCRTVNELPPAAEPRRAPVDAVGVLKVVRHRARVVPELLAKPRQCLLRDGTLGRHAARAVEADLEARVLERVRPREVIRALGAQARERRVGGGVERPDGFRSAQAEVGEEIINGTRVVEPVVVRVVEDGERKPLSLGPRMARMIYHG